MLYFAIVAICLVMYTETYQFILGSAMSSQRGNAHKRGAPAHANATAWRNNLHNSSRQTKALNAMEVSGVCVGSRDQINWRIKFNEYKQVNKPAKW